MKNREIQTLDCTIRDGGYLNNWDFSRDLVREVYRVLSKGGIDFVELGFRSSDKYFDPKKHGIWRFSREEDLLEVSSNILGSKISIMGDYGKIDLEDLPGKDESCISMVRVAAHKTQVNEAIDLLEEIKAKGYLTSLQCMGYSTFTETEKQELLNALKNRALDYVYVADSYGSIFPFQIKELFEPFLELGTFKVGFHPHNNLQMAFANTLEAMRVGVHIVDTTIYGIGRGAGNLPTEILLSYLFVQGQKKYNVTSILSCINRFFLDLMNDMSWGYQLPYMISGIFNSHPNYPKELLRRKEYSIEDIWQAMEYIKELKPVGFDDKIVDNFIKQGFIGLMNVLDKKKSASFGDSWDDDGADKTPDFFANDVPYVNRHPDREFLVLANGPALKSHKAEIDLFIKKYDPVLLGANYLNGLFEPDYHAFNNKNRFLTYINKVSPKSNLMLGKNISQEMISDYVSRDYESLIFRNILDADFDIENGAIMTSCHSISILLIGVAVVMGAKRVFVSGMDGYLHKEFVINNLFYDEKFETDEYDLNVDRHRWNEKFLQQIDEYMRKNGGEGIHILTPTSHSRFFKCVSNYV